MNLDRRLDPHRDWHDALTFYCETKLGSRVRKVARGNPGPGDYWVRNINCQPLSNGKMTHFPDIVRCDAAFRQALAARLTQIAVEASEGAPPTVTLRYSPELPSHRGDNLPNGSGYEVRLLRVPHPTTPSAGPAVRR